jgi:DNA-binding NarL/FixJ family response regulator
LDLAVVSVLLVDDEPAFCILTRMLLEDQPDVKVVGEASNGKEAIASAARLRPDVILLDLSMPVMSGLEALPRLRAANPGALIIVVSVARDQKELHQAKMAGASGFIDKALPNDEFVRAFKECLAPVGGRWSEHRRPMFD